MLNLQFLAQILAQIILVRPNYFIPKPICLPIGLMMGFPLFSIVWNAHSKRACSFDECFPRQFPKMDHIWGLFCARMSNSPYPSLPGGGSGGSTVSYAHATSSSRFVFVFDVFFFSMWVFFHEHSRITGLQGKGEGISLTPQYHSPPLHRHLDISRAITPESSPLHIASSRTRTGNLWFPSASR